MTGFLAKSAICCNGFLRWDFSLGCPNKAGALAACVLVFLLGVMLRTRSKPLALAACLLSMAVGFALAHTFSRGGLVAFLLGAAILFAVALRSGSLSSRRWHLLSVVAAVIGSAVVLGFTSRIAHGVPGRDASVDNRLVIWKNVPRMIADSPDGWGKGQSGNAYMNWYQPLDMNERYRTLVSCPLSHLTENGNFGRFTAFTCAFLLAGVLLAHLKKKSDAVPLAVWSTFFTASLFSTVAENRILWILPLATLLSIRCFPRRLFLLAPLCAAFSLAALHTLALLGDRTGVSLSYNRSENRLTIGDENPAKWMLYDEKTIGTIESGYARTFRAWLMKNDNQTDSIGIAFNIAALPKSAEHIILCGDVATNVLSSIMPQVKEIRILSPRDPDAWLRLRDPKIRIYCGELSDNQPEEEDPAVTFISGSGDYLREWPSLAFGD